jgi:hypothetical protein
MNISTMPIGGGTGTGCEKDGWISVLPQDEYEGL